MRAFASGPILWRDDFARADVTSIDAEAEWISPATAGDAQMGIATGALQRVSGSGWAGAMTAKVDWGRAPALDFVWVLAATPDTTNEVLFGALGSTTPTPGTGGYVARVTMNGASPSRWRLQRWVAGSSVATHVDVTDVVAAAGDAVGVRLTPTVAALWRRQGGVWTQVGSTASDANITAGSVVIETQAGATRIDEVRVHRALDWMALVGVGA